MSRTPEKIDPAADDVLCPPPVRPMTREEFDPESAVVSPLAAPDAAIPVADLLPGPPPAA